MTRADRSAGRWPSRWAGGPVWLVVLVVPLAVLAPTLGRGYLLSYDMVFVPRQSLHAEYLGLGSELPRSVPVDAVVALATTVVRGDILQQVTLFATLALACLGAARAVPTDATSGRVAAALVYGWNPFVAERLVQGHWALLVGYAALPWVLVGAAGLRQLPVPAEPTGRTAPAGPLGWLGRHRVAGHLVVLRRAAPAVLALGIAALSPTAGLLAAALALAVLGWPGGPPRGRRVVLLGGAAVVLNAPWWVAGVLHPGGAGSDPAGVAAFAARAESWAGTVGSLLGLGGIWNAQVVPASRSWPVAPLLSGLLLVVAALGWSALRRRLGSPALALAAVAAGGFVLALAGALPPVAAVLRWLVAHVAGFGLLRDGQKYLAPFALLLALTAGLGAERVLGWLSRGAGSPASRRLLTATAASALALLPVLTTPDLGWGVAGRLQGAHYPADWAVVRAMLASSDEPGEVVALPYGAFRDFAWNGRRTVLDPAPRYLTRSVIVDDRLVVGGRSVTGEDPRAAAVRQALDAGRPLSSLGVGWVLVEAGTTGALPPRALRAAQPRYAGPDLQLYRLPERPSTPSPAALRPAAAAVLVADGLALGVLLAAGALALTAGRPYRLRQHARPPAPGEPPASGQRPG